MPRPVPARMHPRDDADDPGLARTPRRGPDGPYVGAAWRRPARFAREPRLDALLRELSDGFGPQRWWPAETPFEVAVGALLVQNTAWRNAERALARLRSADALTPAALLWLEEEALAALVRSSGTFRTKATRLRAFARWYRGSGGLRALSEASLPRARAELLGVPGIGPETADAVLCFAAGRRSPIASAYARRVLARHGLCEPDVDYESLRTWLLEALAPSLLVHQEFHALVVRAGGQACGRTARCERCPATRPQGH